MTQFISSEEELEIGKQYKGLTNKDGQQDDDIRYIILKIATQFEEFAKPLINDKMILFPWPYYYEVAIE